MPYIKKELREDMDTYLYGLKEYITEPGELNYCFTMLIKFYLNQHGKSYQTINDCIGVLEAAKLEFYRREASIYEDLKRDINGDVSI